jgi:DNA adenine methylase
MGEKHYYRYRAQNPEALSEFDRAIRFVYLNRFCFNGIFRTNTAGKFNVPYGGDKTGALPSVESFRQCAILLDKAKLRNCDFGSILSRTGEGDFVYIDPPYAVKARRVFRQYGSREFVLEDLLRLSKHLEAMDERGVHFVVTYADCSEARTQFAKWNPRRIQVRRNIAGFTGSRRFAYELLATNTREHQQEALP